MSTAPEFTEPVPAAVWDAEDENDTAPEVEAPAETVDAEAAVVAAEVETSKVAKEETADEKLVREVIESGNYAPAATFNAKQRSLFIKALAEINKAEKAKVREQKAAALGASDTSELDARILGDVTPKVLALPKQTTEGNTEGFWRHTGSYVHEGVTYHVTVTAKVAKRRGRGRA